MRIVSDALGKGQPDLKYVDQRRKVVSEAQKGFLEEHGVKGILNGGDREQLDEALSMALQDKQALFSGGRVPLVLRSVKTNAPWLRALDFIPNCTSFLQVLGVSVNRP